jgi:DNA helicase-2/ATP-dependent DNA helicase PcrA
LLSNKYGINLNNQQQQAVKHIKGPALVLAGPGSGKTTVITARTAYLIMKAGVNPESILTLTFNKAAQLEMERRFNRIYGSDIGEKVHFSTLHSFCNHVVRDYEKKQGKRLRRIEGNEEDAENKRKIIRELYQQVNEAKPNDDELEAVINEIGLVKNKMIRDLKEIAFSTKNFEELYKRYDEYKKSKLYIDFDDMLTYAYSILNKCPDILSYYREKYQYIQVDEAQDLSKIQFEILKLLIKKSESNLFVVADDDQSIYAFRGAEPQYILNISVQFEGCSLYRLENNYRSSKNIVEISSNFIKNNKQRFDKNHRTDNAYKSLPNLVTVRDVKEQTSFISERLQEHIKEGRSIAVLYRNNLSSIAIVDDLERKGIPFRVRQSRLFFFNHWLVQDILAFLRFSLNQKDAEAFTRIYYKMNRYISRAMLEYALNTQYEESFIDALLNSDDIKPYQQKPVEGLKNEFKRLAGKNPLSALEYIEDGFNYFESVKGYCESTGLSFDYLYSLFGILKSVAEGCQTVSLFLQRISELQGIFEKPNNSDYKTAVTLTTMHSSKGLEYDTVLMVDLMEDETPGIKASEQVRKNNDNSIMEEERRLFYVGMTRAREYLYLVSPAARNGIASKRSVFINEVSNLINKKSAEEIGEGMIVIHKRFGRGAVAAVLEQEGGRMLLEIDFKGVRRKLDLSVCIENGLISF